MTYPGHNPAIPMTTANKQVAALQPITEALYYIEAPVPGPYLFKGTPYVPSFIIADPDTLETIESALDTPFLPLSKWEGKQG